ncbi:MAG: mechanosensitive ion channel [Crocinitomicaceae bacterium]
MKDQVIKFFQDLVSGMGAGGDLAKWLELLIMVIGLAIVVFAMWWVTKKILLGIIHSFAEKSKTTWDDHLVEEGFFGVLSQLMPLFFMGFFLDIVFYAFPTTETFFDRAVKIAFVIVINIAILRFLNAFRKVVEELPQLKDKPLKSIFQLVKIIISLFLVIVMLSIATNQSPVFFLTSLGAMTAVLLLVFKDTILGFVGSIQLSANDMIRVGDWVTMEKYGADGDVMEISLTTVKVQNFDKTITTIPTYSFISDSFKNWRGMEESDGRRIVRAINVTQKSIKFLTKSDIEKYKKIAMISDFIESKESEIQEFNVKNNIPNAEMGINGRNQTNIGLFRKYMEYYLKNNPNINTEMTCMVRLLPGTEKGVPLQVYVFSKVKAWAEYEVIVGDIFDHLLASVPYFDLDIFESPSGADFKTALSQ